MIIATTYAPECIEWFRKRTGARESAHESVKLGTSTPVTDEMLAAENEAHDEWMRLAKEDARRLGDWIAQERAKLKQ